MSEQKPKQKRRLAAIMFSDIVGFSSEMGADEQRAVRILATHNKIFDMAIRQHDGTVIKQMGDGVLVEFGSAVDSVACAMDIQDRVRKHNGKCDPGLRFEVRIGVHLGDVLVVGNDIIGDGVNVASRIEPMATPGGICISQDVYNQVHNKMEITTVALGPQQFKNIERQIEIYKVLAQAAEAQTGAAVAAVVPTAGPAGSAAVSPADIPVARPASKARASDAAPHSSRRTLWTGIAIGVGAVFALLIVGGVMKDGQRRKAEQQAVASAIDEAKRLADEGKLDDARAKLEGVIAEVRPKTPGIDEAQKAIELIEQRQSIDQSIEKARSLADEAKFDEARTLVQGTLRTIDADTDGVEDLRAALTRIDYAETITNRYRDYVRHLYNRDWDECLKVIDPDSRATIGGPGMRFRLGALRLAAEVLKVDLEKVRVKNFRFADDMRTATTRAEIYANGVWNDTNNDDHWRFKGGQWYLVIK
ncbi:MAG: hypothetical protein GC159_15705 [Phycisphaera sp.]|nr:hypothetical protein [Phycisphaera sp.]